MSIATKSGLQPALESWAIVTARKLMPDLKRRIGCFNLDPFKQIVDRGEMMSRLLSLQSKLTQSNIDSHLSFMKRGAADFTKQYRGVSVSGKTPQQWYFHVDTLAKVSTDDKGKLKRLIHAVAGLQALLIAIAKEADRRKRSVHSVTARFNIVTTKFSYLRILLDELSARMPSNVTFDEKRLGKELLRRMGGQFNRGKIPIFLNPKNVRYMRVSFADFVKTSRSWMGLIKNDSNLAASMRWAVGVNNAALIHTLKSACSTIPKVQWNNYLTAVGIPTTTIPWSVPAGSRTP